MREYEESENGELIKGRKKIPHFFSHIARQKGYYNPQKKNYCKLKYLYQEYYDKNNKSYKNMKNELINSIKSTINEKHVELYKILKLTKQKKQV